MLLRIIFHETDELRRTEHVQFAIVDRCFVEYHREQDRSTFVLDATASNIDEVLVARCNHAIFGHLLFNLQYTQSMDACTQARHSIVNDDSFPGSPIACATILCDTTNTQGAWGSSGTSENTDAKKAKYNAHMNYKFQMAKPFIDDHEGCRNLKCTSVLSSLLHFGEICQPGGSSPVA